MKMQELSALCVRLKNGTYDERDTVEAGKLIMQLITEADEADARAARAEDAAREMQEAMDALFVEHVADEADEGYEED